MADMESELVRRADILFGEVMARRLPEPGSSGQVHMKSLRRGAKHHVMVDRMGYETGSGVE